jgi:uncharacterized membrane protein
LKNLKKFFSYFFETEARSYICFGLIFFLIFEILKNGFSNLINFILNLPLIIIGAFLLTFSEIILYLIWNCNTDADCKLLENGKAKIIFYSNCCATLCLYILGSIYWF